jgi:hypothetical protein
MFLRIKYEFNYSRPNTITMKNILTISMFVFAASILASTALVVNPTKIAYAQGNVTATVVVDADGIIKALKAKHPVLAALAGEEDKDLVIKIKALDAKEAVKAALALNIIRELQQYKAIDAAQ